MKKSNIEKIKKDLKEVTKMQASYNDMLKEIRYLDNQIPTMKNSIKERAASLNQSFTCDEIEEIIQSQSKETELLYFDWCDHSNPQLYYECNSFDELKLRHFLQSFLVIKDYIDISVDKALTILQKRLLPFDEIAPSTQYELMKINDYYNGKGTDELGQFARKHCPELDVLIVHKGHVLETEKL